MSTARETWKSWHRQQHIIQREMSKVWEDMIFYGAGFTETGPHIPDYIRHIPIQDIRASAALQDGDETSPIQRYTLGS